MTQEPVLMLLPAGGDATGVEMTFGDWVQLIVLIVGAATCAFYVVGGVNGEGKTRWQRFKSWLRCMWDFASVLDGFM